jgi:SAM-dependent methyltransferase
MMDETQIYADYGLTNEETSWSKRYQLPPPINMMETHERREKVFVVQGTKMFKAIENCILTYCGPNIKDFQIVDFGCGVGRVALPLFDKYRKPDRCFDVDPSVIEYLRKVIPDASPETIQFTPPMPVESNSVDCLFAVSVWTHLDPSAADTWMQEVIRVLRPGGIALITTASYASLAARKKLGKTWVWNTITDEELREKGMIFHQHPPTPGVTGVYGLASHDPEWLKKEWSAKYMPVIDIVIGGILGQQDINVMRKPA